MNITFDGSVVEIDLGDSGVKVDILSQHNTFFEKKSVISNILRHNFIKMKKKTFSLLNVYLGCVR